MSRSDYLDRLTKAISSECNCHASHKETVNVPDIHTNDIDFHGNVEVFDLTGHPTATTAYAWEWQAKEGQTKHLVMISDEVVQSPLLAVRAAIVCQKFL